MCGCDVLKGHRFTLLSQTLNGFGVKLKGQELYVEAQKETFCWAKHSLLQAVLSVDDLFYSAKPNVEPFFFEDAAAWLDSLGIRYTPRLSLVGRSRFQNYFDFAIPKSKNAGERLIKLVKDPTNDAARLALFSWADTKAQRGGHRQNSMSFIEIHRQKTTLNLEQRSPAMMPFLSHGMRGINSRRL